MTHDQNLIILITIIKSHKSFKKYKSTNAGSIEIDFKEPDLKLTY